MIKIVKVLKIIGIIAVSFMIYNAIDYAQAMIFNNPPLISFSVEKDKRGGKREYGLFFNTYIYCNNEKKVTSNFKAYLRPYNYKGCEKDEGAKDLVKTYLSSLVDKQDYTKEEDYIFLTKHMTGCIIAIEDLYKDNELTEEETKIAIKVIEEISDCSIEKESNKKWETPEDFFSLWKDSKCRKEYMKKYSIK